MFVTSTYSLYKLHLLFGFFPEFHFLLRLEKIGMIKERKKERERERKEVRKGRLLAI